ncbi:outer membrane beta-barrel protein [Vibrio methylphosphonaticus]|uniref:outer membrane beta-barrel protein n=1 Tax=Vibrio methylphosphonaticus TaxID=2946866 RepID=UPI00202A0336|nr:outer membrane beta-barrel protein [Vibrio methylphosphonaticus]MCL9777370.1 porin family protein [Vibrio methylphosphonaticus]
MKKTLLALALVGASTSAFADAWLYGGVSAGRADYNDNSDTPMGFHVGTGILPIIGVEAGYWKHGNFDINANQGNGYAELGSWYAALKPSIDIGPVQLYAKGGLHYYNADYKSGLSSQSSDNGTDFMYGVGAEYFVTDMLSVGASWQRFNGVKTVANSKDLDSFTINATLHIF